MRLRNWIKAVFRVPLLRATVRIQAGPLKGKKISIISGARFIRGQYEPEKTAAFQKSLRSGDFVLDVGGHIGYFSMLASMIVGKEGLVFTFEPLKRNYDVLKQNLSANGLKNVEHYAVAVSRADGTAEFDSNTGSGTGHLAEAGRGNIRVQTVALDSFPLPRVPNLIKIDIEGGEVDALMGLERIIARSHPTLIVAVHSVSLKDQTESFLHRHGYSITILNPSALKGDTELIATWDQAPRQLGA